MSPTPVWWYEFVFKGERVRESTRQGNKRIAGQLEAAHKTRLAKAEVGLKDPTQVPTLRQFAEQRFLPFIVRQFAAKPKTVVYYQQGVKRLLANPQLGETPLDEITPELITAHAAARRDAGMAIASANRQLQVLRRIFTLAMEWRAVERILPKIRLLPGETHSERVLTPNEERQYLDVAGQDIIDAYSRALTGIRSTMRNEKPIPLRDPFVLRDFATVLIDCGLRPEECFRLRRANVDDGVLTVHFGKTDNARRKIPIPDRARKILETRLKQHDSEWIFPAPTASGHAEPSTIRDHHAKATARSAVDPFVLYALRHTCLTRWAVHMDPYTLAYLAGHSSFATTKRYVHPQKETVLAAMRKVRKVGVPTIVTTPTKKGTSKK